MDRASSSIVLRRGTATDLSFVMATERLPGYEDLVGRWEETRHRAALEDPAYAYFIAEGEGRPVGFCIVQGWGTSDKVSHVQRVAVAETGRGFGTAMMRALVAHVFTETDLYRLSLGLFPENTRARRTYEAAGFRAEGVARGKVFWRGEHRDELIMAIIRPDFEGSSPEQGRPSWRCESRRRSPA